MTVINTNVKALFSQSSLRTNERALTTAMEQLSTGKRINSAKDDAAGLAIGMRMTADLRGIAVAIRNANDGISMVQTADGALGEVSNMLQRMRELAVQAATGSMSTSNRKALQAELDQLIAEVDNVARTTNFNGIKLLDGTSAPVFLQTGVREGDQVQISIVDVRPKSLGLQGYAVDGEMISGRVNADAVDLAFNDVLINGKPAFAEGTDMSSGGTNITENYASALASAINTNVGQHRVKATAFNTLKGVAPTATVFDKGDITINGVEIGAAGSVEDLVSVINRDAPGVTATLGGDGSIELSNDTGADIVIDEVSSGTAAKAGFSVGSHLGYVTYSSLDREKISVIARSEGNGYVGGLGEVADVKLLGLNESQNGSVYSGGMVSDDKLDVDDDIKINGVRIGTSLDASAIAKASTINLVSEQTGVVATAFTEAQVVVDVSQAAGESFTINGATVSMPAAGTVISIDTIVAAINDAEVGILATTDANGNLFLSSAGGSDIKVAASNGDFIQSVQSRSGEAALTGTPVSPAVEFTVKGRVSLSSNVGAEIRVEAEDSASLDKLGMAAQGGSAVMVGGALTITTQAQAGRAMTAIDLAIEEVLVNRATLGAFQNRLLAAVDNLSTTSLNLTQSRSRIMDTDYAQATTELARSQIVAQASTAMLAQANASQQTVLQLIKQ